MVPKQRINHKIKFFLADIVQQKEIGYQIKGN